MIANLNIEYNFLDKWSIVSYKISYNHKFENEVVIIEY